MRISIQARVWFVTAIAVAEIVVFAGVTTWGLDRYLASEALRERTEAIILRGNELRISIMSAEAAAHGYVVAGDLSLTQRFDSERIRVLANLTALRQDHDMGEGGGAPQESGEGEEFYDEAKLYEELTSAVQAGLAFLGELQETYRKEGQPAAVAMINTGEGTLSLARADDLIRQMLIDEERTLSMVRAEERGAIRNVWLIGLASGAVLVGILILTTMLTARALVAPIRALARGMGAYSSGDRSYRLRLKTDTEMDEIANAFDAMADRLEGEEHLRAKADVELRAANEALTAKTRELTEQSRVITGLARMAEQLQGAVTSEELGAIIVRHGRVLLPELGCSLAVFNPSRNDLGELATWNLPPDHSTTFGSEDCWALRQGRAHLVRTDDTNAVCAHFAGQHYAWTLCIPLVAQGEVLGLFWAVPPTSADGAGEPSSAQPPDPPMPLVTAMAEQMALAIAKFRLAETLRNQSIRDPLTNLFNRRFMEEALDREIARATRSNGTVSVMIFDVDHFKKFNDNFGHDAGDAVLQTLGRVLTKSVRTSDVACRYGGEEFLVILPDAVAQEALRRAEALRNDVRGTAVVQGGRRLERVTISVGVATFPEHGSDRESLIAVADDALRRAKAEGRDRVVGAAAPRGG